MLGYAIANPTYALSIVKFISAQQAGLTKNDEHFHIAGISKKLGFFFADIPNIFRFFGFGCAHNYPNMQLNLHRISRQIRRIADDR
jgi:hypothetical protein